MKWTKVAALFVVAVLASSVLVAQTTGRIEGRVTDKDGAALPGATVTATSPNAQGARITTSDADGRYRLLNLPVGIYLVKSELEGFNIVEASAVQVSLDQTVNLELAMSPIFGEAVTVTAEAPTIDLKTTTGGAKFSEQMISDLPTTRTFNGLAFQAPGVVAAGNPDGGAQEPSIGGASAAENRYVVDGLDTTDPAFGTIGSTLAFEFIEEVQVKTGGYEAEYGGALGGTLNVITKSGSNELRGDVFGYYNDDSLQSEAPPLVLAGRDLGYTEYDFGADLGGKFIEDKLWYFVAVNPSYFETDRTTATSPGAITTSVDRLYYAGKLTWQIAPSHQLVFSAFGDPTDRENDALSRNALGLVAHDIETGADSFGATYNATIGSNMLFEAAAGFYDQTETQTPLTQEPLYIAQNADAASRLLPNVLGCATSPTPSLNPGLVGVRGCVGGSFDNINGDRSRDDYRAALSWFTGTGSIDHEMKFGVNYREVEYRDHANTPGGITGVMRDAHGVIYDADGIAGQRWNIFGAGPNAGFYVASLSDYDQNSHGFTDETALFAQDQMRIGDYFTLNLGIRAEEFNSTGNKSGLSEFDGGNRQLDFGYGDTIAPRIGFTWDVVKNGKSKLFAHFGRFYESVPLDINVRAFGNENYNFHYFYFYDQNSLPDAGNMTGVWYYSYILGAGTGVSQDMDPMYTEEFVAGFEYEVAPNMSVGIRYVDRSVENVIEDISVDDGHTYFITNPGGCFTVNPVDGSAIDETCFPEATREYKAVELTFNKRFSNNWQMGASYVWSENKGNYGGLFRQENGQLDPNITSLFDLPDLLVGATGRLPNDREHQFKVYGSYVWPFRLVTGFTGQYLTGTPMNKFGRHTVYGYERFIVPRGTAGELDDFTQIDAHIEFPFSFGDDLELKLIADVFNIFDEDTATAVDERWTSRRSSTTSDPNECGGGDLSCPTGIRTWGQPTAYQTPQTIRLGVKLSF